MGEVEGKMGGVTLEKWFLRLNILHGKHKSKPV